MEGREKQHDPMLFSWSCKRIPRLEPPAWPPTRDVRPRTQVWEPAAPWRSSSARASGATEHAEELRGALPELSLDPAGIAGGAAVEETVEETWEVVEPDEMSPRSSVITWGEGEEGGDAEEDKESLDPDAKAEHFSELAAIGFALGKSAALLLAFDTIVKEGEVAWKLRGSCMDAAWMKPMVGACTPSGRAELNCCMVKLFTRRPLLQSTPPKEDKTKPRRLKSSAEIEEAWKCILERRRLSEPDDRCAINDKDRLANMWVA